MSWKITGTLWSGPQGFVEWTDGLTGTQEALADMHSYESPSVPLTPTGPFFQVSFTDPDAMFALAQLVFKANAVIIGDPPQAPAVPEKAVS